MDMIGKIIGIWGAVLLMILMTALVVAIVWLMIEAFRGNKE